MPRETKTARIDKIPQNMPVPPSHGRRRRAGSALLRWPVSGTTIAALTALAGCNGEPSNVVFQTLGAGSRTVVDLVLTAYANTVSAALTLLQSSLTGG